MNKKESGEHSPKIKLAKDYKEPPRVRESGGKDGKVDCGKKQSHHEPPSLPQINLTETISEMAFQTALAVRNQDIFTMEGTGDIVTIKIDPEDVSTLPMDKFRFTSWVERFAEFGRWTEKKNKTGESKNLFIRKSINTSIAEQILRADSFRDTLRPLKGVRDIRLPAWDGPGNKKLRLPEEGYDEQTLYFTVDKVPYRLDMPLEEAIAYLVRLFKDFPFIVDRSNGEPGRSLDGSHLMENRSFAVLMGLAIAAFGNDLWEGMLKCGFVTLANQAGTGKTILIRLAVCPPFGEVVHKPMPKTEEEIRKNLTTFLNRPIAFFDNAKGFLDSASLEAFMTSPIYSDRILQQSKSISGKPGFVVISGNNLQLNKDLFRRFLVCELFCEEEDATEVEPENPISASWPNQKENRAALCSALWSILRHWEWEGSPKLSKGLINSYEEFSGILGGIVKSAGFSDPLHPCDAAKDEREEATKLLLRESARDIPPGGERQFSPQDFLQKAYELNLTDIIVGLAKEPEKAIGHRLKKYRGLYMKDCDGRRFKVRKKDLSVGACYIIKVEK